MKDDNDRELTHRFVAELDQLPVPARATPAFNATAARGGLARGALALGGLAAALLLAAYVSGTRDPVASVSGTSASPSATPSVAPSASAASSATTKVDPTPTPASFDPRFVRVLWVSVPQRQSVVFQEEEHAGTITEMRLVRVSDATVIATAPVRQAVAGEPRVCGHPDVAPPLVAAMPASTPVLDDLRREGGPTLYRLEVRTAPSSPWFAVQTLDWSKLAGGPCFQ